MRSGLLPAAVLTLVLAGTGTPPPAGGEGVPGLPEGPDLIGGSDQGPVGPERERLAYTVTYLGIPVARAILDQLPPDAPGGEWLVRASSRTTRFWDRFFHIRNVYTTRFGARDFLPSVYERRIDQKRLRFRSVDRYGGGGGDRVAWTGLPPLPDRYVPRGVPDRVEARQVERGQGNLFSALWWVRFADWDRLSEATRAIWVDGVRWRITIRRMGLERQRAPGGRLDAWKLVMNFERLDREVAPEQAAERRRRTDYVTNELVRESVTITFWLAREPARRPLALIIKRPKLTVRAVLRELFEEERYPPAR